MIVRCGKKLESVGRTLERENGRMVLVFPSSPLLPLLRLRIFMLPYRTLSEAGNENNVKG